MSTSKATVDDFKSAEEIRWCPGCGDYGILSAVQRAMADSGVERENFVVVSGIGCSSRFPYYVNTYGLHGIHGRASAIASGVRCGNKKLKVIQITGDGDALAIGGNHFIHTIRRNMDITILLFNNEIYGLTKGQYSPTSQMGTVTSTSPLGTIEHPFQPSDLTIGSMGKFFARTVDKEIALTKEIILEAMKHKGTSVVEILQNCFIYNDGIHHAFADRAEKENNSIVLQHGKRLLFGKEQEKGLMLNERGKLEVVDLRKHGVSLRDILVHNAHDPDCYIHQQLANMKHPDYPVALGIIRQVDAATYDDCMEKQTEQAQHSSCIRCADELFSSGSTWEVK